MSKEQETFWRDDQIISMTNAVNENFKKMGIDQEMQVFDDYIRIENLEIPVPNKGDMGRVVYALNYIVFKMKWASEQKIKDVGVSLVRVILDEVKKA